MTYYMVITYLLIAQPENLSSYNEARSVTHSNWSVSISNHLHGDGKVLQVVAEQTEGFKLLKSDALSEKERNRTQKTDLTTRFLLQSSRCQCCRHTDEA